MTQKEHLELLHELKTHIESRSFQELVMKPIFKELDGLKYAYDCDSLRELQTLKGKKQGIKFLIELLKDVDVDIKNLRDELENS